MACFSYSNPSIINFSHLAYFSGSLWIVPSNANLCLPAHWQSAESDLPTRMVMTANENSLETGELIIDSSFPSQLFLHVPIAHTI